MIHWKHMPRRLAKSPLLWGGVASAVFYGLIHGGVLSGDFIQAYCAGHPVEYAAMIMFFVGGAILILKSLDVQAQYPGLSEPLLGPMPRTAGSVATAEDLLGQLQRQPDQRKDDYLNRRLRGAIEHVRGRGSADSLDDQLKYLADLDADRLHASYALVRVIIWAIPILGFLGTVIGITLAIANLAPGAVEDSLPAVISGLSVAFATTTQALVLSMVLMFAQYFVDQRETALLNLVDARADELLNGRFEQLAAAPDGQLAAVRRMADEVIQASGRQVQQQAELWQASMETTARRYNGMTEAAGRQLRAALSESLQVHAQQLGANEQAAAGKNWQHWEQVQQSQTKQAQAIASLQTSMTAQAEVLHGAIRACGEVAKLEETLNRNLTALAGAKHFEQTVLSLAAAINLLNARLAEAPTGTAPICLKPKRTDTQAA